MAKMRFIRKVSGVSFKDRVRSSGICERVSRSRASLLQEMLVEVASD